VGPLGVPLEPLSALSYDEAKDAFKEQVRAFSTAGWTFFILETFGLAKELEQAIRAVKEVAPDAPIIAQFTVNDEGTLLSGSTLESAVKEIAHYEIDAVGLNCSIGPRSMLEALEHLKTLTALPISVQPNAGVPQNVGGRYIYMTSPEYIAEYAKRFIQTGASIRGRVLRHQPRAHPRDPPGGAGAAAGAPDGRAGGRTRPPGARVGEGLRSDGEVAPRDQTRARRVRHARGAGVARGVSPAREVASARRLHHFGIDAINIPDGPRASARMSALAMAVLLHREVGIEVVLHYACRDRNVIGMQSDLLGAWALGCATSSASPATRPSSGTTRTPPPSSTWTRSAW